MKYVSTRGNAPVLAFDDVVLAGLARDGGLYLPETWPRLSAADLRSLKDFDYPALAARIIAPFAAPVVSEADLHAIAVDAYENFDHPDVAPLKSLGGDTWLLELFHGPTLAFKDFALQVLGRLFDFILARRSERITIVGATSGDTGSAAIEACRDRDSIEIFILHPEGRVSDVQRKQMTTVTAENVHNVAIEGTFDDCQDLVKAMFNDIGFRDRFSLGAVNSINWARIVAQVVYYVHAALKLDATDRGLDFAVPTGNFGNVFAGYAAREMGLPIRRLVIGSNRNDILTRFFASGRMAMGDVSPTLSPSMDIQVSSNFERFLFELFGRDGSAVSDAMTRFREAGAFDVGDELWRRSLEVFDAKRYDDDETKDVIRAVFEETGELLDPHSAIGVAAARNRADSDGVPIVALATAHPAKFPEAVEAATGIRPPLPARLADLLDRTEHYDNLPVALSAIEDHISQVLTKRGGFS